MGLGRSRFAQQAWVLAIGLAVGAVGGCKKDTVHGGLGQSCKKAEDCERGLLCSGGLCRGKQASGQPCKVEHDCTEGICVAEMCRGNRPVGAECKRHVDCVEALACVAMKCSEVGALAAAVAQQGCACKEAACITEATQELEALATKYQNDIDAAARKRVRAAQKALSECTRRAVFGR